MTLIRNGKIVDDVFTDVSGADVIPATGAIIVGLGQWLENIRPLRARRDPLAIRLRSDEHPEVIADDLDCFALIELEFPVFRDGRPYSYARLLRERWGFRGELRAVGDVLLEQLHYMQRVGFDAFQIASDDPLMEWRIADREFSVWYQASGDGRAPAHELRHRLKASRRIA